MADSKSRTQHLKQNIIVGFAAQFATLILSFVGRRLFVNYLSVDYLGINGLYTNILSVLSLAELGLGSVVSFSLYKPVVDDNQPLIRALVAYFKKLYLIIAGAVTAVGLGLIPFLKYIVRSDLSESDLIIYYVLFLASTVSTYFVAHKVALLGAYQENRVQKYVALGTAIIQQIVHIVILLLKPNYLIYVLSTIVCTIISNFVLSRITSRKFKYLSKKDGIPEVVDKKVIKTNVKATGLYKLSTVLINSTDNILISVIVSTAAVGLYSNYYIIVGALQTFISIITASLINSVGNLHTEQRDNRMFDVFSMLTLAYHFVSAYCAISMYYIFNDFIPIWLGSAFLMDKSIVFAIAFNFYLTNLMTPIWSFREATGQFYKAKYIMLACAILNIGLSVLLGICWGVCGILLATAISKLLTMFWFEPQILFKNVFHLSQKTYWCQQTKYIACSVICFVICGQLSSMLSHDILSIIIRGVIFFAVCIGVFVLINFKSKEVCIFKNELKMRGIFNVHK